MNIDSFEGLLVAAALQREPQHLLMTFAAAEQEPEPVPGLERAGPRHTLVPLMCVSKRVGELDTFANLAREAREAGAQWDVVLVTTLAGQSGQPPAQASTDAALKQMVRLIQVGQMERFLAFDQAGDLLRFS
ncbi:hypothetical protein HSX11_20160 [Oxalobacteraceae bacterium]|nr:hypothetical protein [Oxalobacteraceae bacterium]